jgi:hypothetical protein
MHIADNINRNATSTFSVYLGSDTKASFSGATNEIVIGYDASGVGSNSVVLGNDGITKTILKGNVGIGTTAPAAKLHLADSIDSEIRLESPNNKARFLAYGGGDFWIQSGVAWTNGSTDNIKFSGMFGSPVHMTITSSSNIGIGTTIPTEKLEINGGVRLNPTLAKPACTPSKRGTLWFTPGGGIGGEDALEICASAPNQLGILTFGWKKVEIK